MLSRAASAAASFSLANVVKAGGAHDSHSKETKFSGSTAAGNASPVPLEVGANTLLARVYARCGKISTERVVCTTNQ